MDAIVARDLQFVNQGSIRGEQSWTWAEVKFDNSDATIRKMATDFLADLASSGLMPDPAGSAGSDVQKVHLIYK